MTLTLGEAYPLQQARVRKVLGHAKEIGPAGLFLVILLEDLLQRADRAAIERNLPAMISIYQEMQAVQE